MNDDGASGLEAVIHADGSAVLTVDETPQEIATTAAEDARREIVERAAAIARQLGHPVPVVVHEPDGTWPLLIHPDGEVESDEGRRAAPVVDMDDEVGPDAAVDAAPEPDADAVAAMWAPASEPADSPGSEWAPPGVEHTGEDESPAAGPTEEAEPAASPAPEPVEEEDAPHPVGAVPLLDADTRDIPVRTTVPASTAPAAPASAIPAPDETPVAPRRPSRHATAPGDRPSFLVPERAEEPATQGWRRGLVAIGLRVPPNSAERREREDIAAVSRLWPEPRTIAVVNGKGGSGKTPTAILLAAVFARRGGAGVLAWDNNQTRGTLGWRTEKSDHDATLHDLLPETERLLTSGAQSADLARFVHHQARDRFDVLRSQPIALAEEQRMDSEDVSRIHAVAAKYYRLIIMDSGNDESDPMWLRMIDHTDQLVVATTTRGEHAEAGALLLEALAARDERTAALAHGAVTIVSQADPNASTDEVRRVVQGFGGLARDVATIPYDPAMIGGALRFDALRPATQRAWLSAGATIARGLGPAPV
jgi:MinD-like ATPase involved in chromosome partitioning or flagellar assembly